MACDANGRIDESADGRVGEWAAWRIGHVLGGATNGIRQTYWTDVSPGRIRLVAFFWRHRLPRPFAVSPFRPFEASLFWRLLVAVVGHLS